MSSSRNNTLAGLFVLVCIALALAVVILLGGALERLGKRDYSVRFDLVEGVMGLVPGARVTVGGREAGTVKALRYDPDNDEPTGVIVTVSIDRRLELREGTVAQLNAPLLGGTGSINFPTVGAGRALTQGDMISGDPAPPAFLASAGYGPEQVKQVQSIIRRADEISAKFITVADEVQVVLTDAKTVIADARGRSTGWFDRVDSITKYIDDTAARAPKLADDLQARLDQLREMFSTAQAVLEENREDVRESIKNARSVTEKGDQFLTRLNGELVDIAKGFLEDGRGAITRAQEAVERVNGLLVENTPSVRRSVANLRLASDQLTFMLAEVRRSPWRLLYRPDKRELEFELLYDSAALYAGAVSDLRAAAETVEALSAPDAPDAPGAPGAPLSAQSGGSLKSREAIDAINSALERYKAVEQQFLEQITRHAAPGK